MARLRVFLLAYFVAPAVALALACGDSEEGSGVPVNTPQAAGATAPAPSADQQAVESAVRSTVDAFNRQDARAFLDGWTDAGLEASFGATRQQILSAPEVLFGGPPRVLRRLENTRVSAGSASTEAEFSIGLGLARERLLLVREGNVWKFDGTEALDVDVPRGTTAVAVEFKEFAFEYDASQVPTSGSVAFSLRNSGEQSHELVLLRTPPGFTVRPMVESQALPPDVEVLAGFGPLGPGVEGNLVLIEPLPPGHYTMVCLLPDAADPRGTQHALKGMVSSFALPVQGGSP